MTGFMGCLRRVRLPRTNARRAHDTARGIFPPAKELGLLLPAAALLLPVGDAQAPPAHNLPLPAGDRDLVWIRAIEQHDAARVAVELAGLGAFDQEQGVGLVGV